MLRFRFYIKKWANFYFFVQNLSGWHFSNNPFYNEFWKKELGGFRTKEKIYLKSFAKLHKRYSFGKDFFGQIFFTSRDPLLRIKKEIPHQDFQLLFRIFSVLAPSFEKLYSKDRLYLKEWRKILTNQLNNSSIVNYLNHTLARLYNTEPFQKPVKVYLLLSSPNSSGGSASSDGENISLEISRYPIEKANDAIGIIFHELIHLYFEKQYLIPLLNKIFNNDQAKVNLVREAIASALLPNGLLGKLFFKIKPSSLHIEIPREYNKELINLTKKYVRKNLYFDELYIKRIYRVIKPLKDHLK